MLQVRVSVVPEIQMIWDKTELSITSLGERQIAFAVGGVEHGRGAGGEVEHKAGIADTHENRM